MILMNSIGRRRDKSINSNRTSKAIAAVPIAGIVVAASLLLSGIVLISSYQQPAIAQEQNMTGEAAGGGNASTTGATGGASNSEVMFHLEEVRKALENNDVQGAMMHLDVAMSLLGGGSSSTQGNMTMSTTGSSSSMG
jgi:hypothetical protein